VARIGFESLPASLVIATSDFVQTTEQRFQFVMQFYRDPTEHITEVRKIQKQLEAAELTKRSSSRGT